MEQIISLKLIILCDGNIYHCSMACIILQLQTVVQMMS